MKHTIDEFTLAILGFRKNAVLQNDFISLLGDSVAVEPSLLDRGLYEVVLNVLRREDCRRGLLFQAILALEKFIEAKPDLADIATIEVVKHIAEHNQYDWIRRAARRILAYAAQRPAPPCAPHPFVVPGPS